LSLRLKLNPRTSLLAREVFIPTAVLAPFLVRSVLVDADVPSSNVHRQLFVCTLWWFVLRG
jgi:hypothetical protein